MSKISYKFATKYQSKNVNFLNMSMQDFKALGVLLLLIFTNSISVDAQKKYHFTLNPKQDTVVVYDAHDNVVLLYGKDVFVYRQTPIKITRDKKEIVFSSPDGELGRVSSKKYIKIHVADGSVYTLVPGKKKLSYKRDGHVCASSEYSFSSGYPYSSGKVDAEMSIDDTDLNLIPFFFQSVLAHIKGTKDIEQLVWQSSILTLF
jgi:hypothetical protein